MKFDAVKNPNYVATVVRVEPGDLFALDGLDNLAGYAKFGMQALVSKDTAPGLYLLFSTEVQLSHDFVRANNLYRDGLANADTSKTGYLENNRRVKAIRLRKHQSDSLLIPVESLSYLLKAKDLAQLAEGDVFDSIDGQEVCRKYLVKQPKENAGKNAPKARVRRVDAKVFPEHLDSEHYFRNLHKVPSDAHITVSQKLHGTSVRYGNVPVLADQTWWERLLCRPRKTTHRFVVGSRRVVKSVDLSAEEGKDHFYGDGDLWTRYADENRLADLIPKDHIVYGELVGFTGPSTTAVILGEDGEPVGVRDVENPIQKDYTYDVPQGTAQLYVYRVSVVTADGLTVDYTPLQMSQFCADRGLKVVPTLWAGPHRDFNAKSWLEARYYDLWASGSAEFTDAPVPLSAKKLVDEGVCVRYDGPYGTYIVKAKSPSFVRHETEQIDAGAEDVEATEGEEVAAA